VLLIVKFVMVRNSNNNVLGSRSDNNSYFYTNTPFALSLSLSLSLFVVYRYGSLEDGQDTCWGDSGGPVFTRIDQGGGTFKDIHVGIVSWGDYCGNSNHPNINARTSSAFAFIKKIVCDEFGTSPNDASFCVDDYGNNNGVDAGDESIATATATATAELDELDDPSLSTNHDYLRPHREKMKDREQILQFSQIAPLD
ncbi:MAG: hypothetical protein ACI8RD_005665, partial [Bacillariaceae sp.]|jgi:hypothetical protein